MVALAGLFLTGIDVFSGLAVGTITRRRRRGARLADRAPRAAVLLGDRVDKRPDPVPGPPPHHGAQVAGVGAHGPPGGGAARSLAGGAAALALLALAVPVLGMRLGSPGSTSCQPASRS